MAIAGGGFPRRVRRVLGCERGNMPECTGVLMLVLVVVCAGTVVLTWLFPGTVEIFAARVEAVALVLLLVAGAVFGLGLLVLCGLVVADWWRLRRGRGAEGSGGPGGRSFLGEKREERG